MSSNWKAAERSVAKLFNTRRTPLSGMNSGHDTNADTLHPKLYIEVKYSQHWPLVDTLKALRAKATGCWSAVLVVGKKNGSKEMYTVLFLEDLNRYFGSLTTEALTAEELANRFLQSNNPGVVSVARSRPITIFEDAATKAKRERKIPFVALRSKGSPLTLLILRLDEGETLRAVAEEYLKSQGVNP